MAASLLKQVKKKYDQILVTESNKDITKTKLGSVPLINIHEKTSDASKTNSTAYSKELTMPMWDYLKDSRMVQYDKSNHDSNAIFSSPIKDMYRITRDTKQSK